MEVRIVGITINSGRAVANVLVIVNGVVLVVTTDYTISGTTLTFDSSSKLDLLDRNTI